MVKVTVDERSPRMIWVLDRNDRRIVTFNLTPGRTVYGERTLLINGIEYRYWDPFRSKLAAALHKGLTVFPFHENTRVLYLGASTGTTVSHVSDIVGDKGVVFAVEFAPRVANELIDRCGKYRSNVITIVESARWPERYSGVFGKADVVYCDIAQPDQTPIAMKNCRIYMKKEGYLFLIIKSRSIDVAKKPSQIFDEEEDKLRSGGYYILERIELSPFDKDHALVVAKVKE